MRKKTFSWFGSILIFFSFLSAVVGCAYMAIAFKAYAISGCLALAAVMLGLLHDSYNKHGKNRK